MNNSPLQLLESWLKPADSTTDKTMAAPDLESGTPITDFTPFNLNQDQKLLVAGEGKIDRSAILHGFIIKLIDMKKSREDVVATILQNDALWKYCLSHRNNDPEKAAAFAITEVDKAYEKSMTGMRAKLVGFNPNWKPSADSTEANITAIPKRKTLRLIPPDELTDMAGQVDWLIRDYLESDAIIMMFGESGTFKSFIAFDIGVSVASGQDWHGHQVRQKGLVVYVCGEGKKGVSKRYKAVCQQRGIDPKSIPFFVTSLPVGLTKEEEAEELKRIIDEVSATYGPPMLIIIDTLARNFGAGADENSTKDMNGFIRSIDLLRGESSVLIIHHTGHENKGRARGAYTLHAGIDAEYMIEFEDHLIRMENKKMKEADLAPLMLLRPTVVNLNGMLDDLKQPITSVVLETSADNKQIRIADFFGKYPKLKYGDRENHLPELLKIIHYEPNISQRGLAEKLGYSLNGVSETLKQLREYELIEAGKGKVLTHTGKLAAAIWHPGIAFTELQERFQGAPKWPPQKLEEVGFEIKRDLI